MNHTHIALCVEALKYAVLIVRAAYVKTTAALQCLMPGERTDRNTRLSDVPEFFEPNLDGTWEIVHR
jgi:hypothetical protein